MMKNFFLRILLLMGLLIAGGGLQAQDYTSSLTNPSFETGNYKGWTVTYPSGTTLTWCGANSDADAATDEDADVEGTLNTEASPRGGGSCAGGAISPQAATA